MSGMLEDVKVLDLGEMVSAPYCARLLADLGADVTKVERKSGDPARRTGPFAKGRRTAESSGLYQYLNFNKRGLTVDLRSRKGREKVEDLIRDADVVIENHPPGTMERWGLGYAHLRDLNRGIVLTSITPFGQTGPYGRWKGDDLVVQHMGGIGYVTPRDGDASLPPLGLPGYQAAFQGALYGAIATMAAVMQARMTGVGTHIDVAEIECVFNLHMNLIADLTFGKGITTRCSNRGGRSLMPCADGYVMMVPGHGGQQWQNFKNMLGNPEWLDGELFSDQHTRAQHWDAMCMLAAPHFATKRKDQVFKEAQERWGLWFGRARTTVDVLASEQSKARGFFVTVDTPSGDVPMPSAPYRFEPPQWAVRRNAPRLVGKPGNELE